MKQDVKEKWVAALRSDEYKQTKGVLRDTYGYCCLGVLCDLYGKEHDVPWSMHPQTPGMRVFDGETTTLPESVRLWAGLGSSLGEQVEFEVDDDSELGVHTEALPEINDAWGKSFNEIANLIEEQL